MGERRLQYYREAVAEYSGADVSTRWKIRDWKPVYTKILVCVGKGMTPTQIAQEAEIGYSKDQIKKIIRDPLFRMKLNQYSKKMDVAIVERATEEMTKCPEIELARVKMSEATEKAADTLLSLIDPSSKLYQSMTHLERKLMVSTVQDILNRAGLKNLVTEEQAKQAREYSPDEIRSALENAKELEAIAQRLDGRSSSYVLSKEERNNLPALEVTDETDQPNPPPSNKHCFFEPSPDSEETSEPSNKASQEEEEKE